MIVAGLIVWMLCSVVNMLAIIGIEHGHEHADDPDAQIRIHHPLKARWYAWPLMLVAGPVGTLFFFSGVSRFVVLLFYCTECGGAPALGKDVTR